MVRVDHLTEAQQIAYRIADNRLAEDGDWATDLLKIELQTILDLKVSFYIELTGFEPGEIDIIRSSDLDDPKSLEPVSEPQRDRPAICNLGDLWQIGRHRLFCGDGLDRKNWQKLMGSERA